jgi:iron donor protein CyaY
MALMESDFRKKIQTLFDALEKGFENVDPDVVECEQTMGSLVLTLSDGARCILSIQPSVNQLWLAMASQGRAYHFNLDPASQKWVDDKGQNLEVVSLLRNFLKEKTGIEINL